MYTIIEKVLEYFPQAEIVARKVLSRNATKKSIIKYTRNHTQVNNIERVPLNQFVDEIKSIGVKPGDLLMIHSSMDGLKGIDASPAQIISCLKEIVGEDGTLVFPVFPYGMKRNADGNEIYDVRKTKIRTGLLPYVFLRYPGTVRSHFPVNTLAANGRLAYEMMRNEMKTDLAHGENSPWKYCVDHNAKVLYLGLRVRQADTLLHVVEDTMDTSWPIKQWYEQRRYSIEDSGVTISDISVRVRKGLWHQYFASYYSGRILAKRKLIIEKKVFDTYIAIIPDTQKFIMTLIQDAKKGRTFYFVPRHKKY